MSMIERTENICRTCLSTDGELVSLFSGISDDARLTNKIMNISDVTINERDGLPCMICRKCIFLVESFDCFKKQIESANNQIKHFCRISNKELAVAKVEATEKVENLKEEAEEYDDSDYEIQYVSEEVRVKVESAFRKKRESARERELAEICTTLKTYRDVALVPIEDIIGERRETISPENERVIKSDRSSIETPRESRLKETELKIAQTCQEASRSEEEIARSENELETFDPLSFDCCSRLIIEEPDDPDQKIPVEETLKPENTENREQTFFQPDSGEQEETTGLKKLENVEKSLETRELDARQGFDSERPKDSELESFEPKEHKNIVEKSLEPRDTVCDNVCSIVKPEKLDNIEKKCPQPLKIDFLEEEIVTSEKPLDTERNPIEPRRDNEEEAPATEGTKDTGKEPSETGRLEKNDEEPSETEKPEKITENNSPSPDSMIETPGIDRKTREIDESEPQSRGNNGEPIAVPENSAIRQNSSQPAEQTVDPEKSHDIDKKPEKIATSCEGEDTKCNIASKKYDPGKTVIVISSDSSDEERRRIYAETANQRTSWLPKSARKKLFQSRVTARKNHVLEFQDNNKTVMSQQMAKNPLNLERKKGQPRKYFQCTSCNISLYSVTAVLYHHNQNHTPPQELLSCQMCDVQFATKIILNSHFDQHVESHLFRCSYCTCEFVLKRNLRAHMGAHMRPVVEQQPEKKRQKIFEKNCPTERTGEKTLGRDENSLENTVIESTGINSNEIILGQEQGLR